MFCHENRSLVLQKVHVPKQDLEMRLRFIIIAKIRHSLFNEVRNKIEFFFLSQYSFLRQHLEMLVRPIMHTKKKKF